MNLGELVSALLPVFLYSREAMLPASEMPLMLSRLPV